MTRPPLKTHIRQVLSESKAYLSKNDCAELERAINLALLWYGPQKKFKGEGFMEHPLEVVSILMRFRLDETSLIAGLVHQAMEDKLVSLDLIREKFDDETATLVENVSRLTGIGLRAKKTLQVQNFRRMFFAMSSDIRVILIKLADRLQILRHLVEEPDSKARQEAAEETLNFYAPIASRLGVQWMKKEFEDHSFEIMHNEKYREVSNHINLHADENKVSINQTVTQLKKLMTDNGVAGEVYGRTKHHYSVFRKMQRKNLDIDEIYDISAFRIIVDTIEDCYRMLGLVHSTWRPIRGMFDDYIAMPKPNGYQSLHTTVIGNHGERMEIQVRTREMHNIAENGIAAHWRYKEGGKARAFNPKEDVQISWMRQLMDVSTEAADSSDLLDQLRLDLFSDYIFVFTPMGDVHELPKGSTPVDFAFQVHTQVGLRCSGAKVDDRIVPLHYKLATGDVVSILTNKNQKPKKEWLEFVKTGKAKSKIRHSIGEAEREQSRALGKELCEREFKKYDLNWNRKVKDGDLQDAIEKLRVKDIDELVLRVGRGEVKVSEIIEEVAPEKITEQPEPQQVPQPTVQRKSKRSKSGIRIGDFDDLLIRFPRCCNPIKGDKIVGFITRGRGVTIHRTDCHKLPRDEPERMIDAFWDFDTEFTEPVTIRVASYDRPGLMSKMSSVFTDRNINIESIHAQTKGGRGNSHFKVHIKDMDELETIRKELRKLKGVYYVERVNDISDTDT